MLSLAVLTQMEHKKQSVKKQSMSIHLYKSSSNGTVSSLLAWIVLLK